MKLSSTEIRGNLRVTDDLQFDMYPWIHQEEAFIKAYVDGNELVLLNAAGREYRTPISGSKGDQGETGERGSLWFTGHGSPAEYYEQKENDFYLNVDNGDLYTYKQGEWKLEGRIEGKVGESGPAGPIGPAGVAGPIGPQGIPGEAGKDGTSVRIMDTLSEIADLESISVKERGDGYLIQSELHVWDTVKWNNVGRIQGPKGDTGTSGSKWHSGLNAPDSTLGQIGDFYINTSTYEFYEKVSLLVWELRGNLQGQRGAQGPTGKTGEGLNFYWKNTQLGVKLESEQAFTFKELRGPAGPKGETGSTGVQGLRGERGEMGPSGQKGETGAAGIGIEFEWNGSQLGVKRDDQPFYQFSELQGQPGPIGPIGPSGPIGPQGRQGIPGPAGPVGSEGCPGVGLQYQWDGTFLGVRREDEFNFKYQDLTGPAGPANVHIDDSPPINHGVLWCDIADVAGGFEELCNLIIGPHEPINKKLAWMETENAYLDATCSLAVGPVPPANKQLVWMENVTNTIAICRSEISEEAPKDKQRVWFDVSDRDNGGEEVPPSPLTGYECGTFKADVQCCH